MPKLAEKCAGLRIFKDENDKLNLSAKDLGYSALVVSQFTLYGDTRKGFRPSFIKAAKPPLAVDAYELFLAEMNQQGLRRSSTASSEPTCRSLSSTRDPAPSSLIPTSGSIKSKSALSGALRQLGLPLSLTRHLPPAGGSLSEGEPRYL